MEHFLRYHGPDVLTQRGCTIPLPQRLTAFARDGPHMNARCHAGMTATVMAQATMSTAVLPTNKCPSTTILPESGPPLKPAEWGIVGVIRLINERREAHHDIVLHLNHYFAEY